MVQGYVLLMMLVYMQIFSLLAMQLTADIIYEKKSAIHRNSTYQLRHQALRVLSDIDRMTDTSCTINKMSPVRLTMQDIRWWRRRGCYLNRGEIEYFYVREVLGVDDCAVITTVNKQQVTVKYYRNTLLQVVALTPEITLLLQDAVAVAGPVPPVCSFTLKQVKSGRQMLRWL